MNGGQLLNPRPLAIAIDGPASSGKGTVARMVARTLGYAYIDTGAMYRAVALRAQEEGIDLGDGARLGALAASIDFRFRWDGEQLQILDGERDLSREIRTETVGRGASAVAVLPAVRAALLGRQRALGADGGVVMDGRDIGTVVLPDAGLKIFLDAAPSERARRRHAELVLKDPGLTYEVVLADLIARDKQDSQRAAAPLRRAEGARLVDSTGQTIEAVVATILGHVASVNGQGDLAG
jgi:cytidylate kinase